MDSKQQREQLILEGRKQEALKAFLVRLREARKRTDLPETVLDAYILGLKMGYGDGLAEGVRLGLKVRKEAAEGFGAIKVGLA
jgi:hypothetical protein